MWCLVAVESTDVSKEHIASILVTANFVASSRILFSYDRGDKFLRNAGSYNSHTASYPRRRHSS
jgi:hypothetical protein